MVLLYLDSVGKTMKISASSISLTNSSVCAFNCLFLEVDVVHEIL